MTHRRKSISRRSFLNRAALGAAGLPFLARKAHPDESAKIDKVHVIFKTHLDIGFTDLAAGVVDTYVHEFIPSALRLARETRERQGPRSFKWTTGSWLIHTFLERADSAERRRMEEAIVAGDICWHALPFTTHSEALDASLFEAGIQLSKRLDARFGRNTISGKMTDVPGHTRALASILGNAGIHLLHIGANLASMPPQVPPVFVWQAPDGARVAVMYQKEYGGVMTIPHTSEAVAMLFTGDNHGPQTGDEVAEAYALLADRFPGAEIAASDLNAVAETVNSVLHRLPVVTAEMGDSWIHGIASDPLKIARMRELSRLRRNWLKSGALKQHSDEDLAFSIPLAMVGEHTWGLDIKTHLHAWDIYTPEALATARTTAPFKRVEASWEEKRTYIHDALAALPEALNAEAQAALDALRAVPPDVREYERIAHPVTEVSTDTLAFALDPDTGAVGHLLDRKTGRAWASAEHPLALFAYQTFSKEDYDRFMAQYLTSRPDWALADFGKPGLEAFDAVSRTWLPRLKDAWRGETEQELTILAELEVLDDQGAPLPGCPRRLFTEYALSKTEPVLQVSFQWFEKAATRLPEALWLSFVPETDPDGAWALDKMGQEVDPRDVVKGGGRKLHAVGKGARYADARGGLRLETMDAPLAAPGDRSLLNFDNALPEAAEGMHFCLCNNVWGTNFVMWFDEDMRFRFHVTCQAADS